MPKRLQAPKMPRATIYITGKELAKAIETHQDIERIEGVKIPLDEKMQVKVQGEIGYGHLLGVLKNIVTYLEKREAYEDALRNKRNESKD